MQSVPLLKLVVVVVVLVVVVVVVVVVLVVLAGRGVLDSSIEYHGTKFYVTVGPQCCFFPPPPFFLEFFTQS